MSGTKNRRTMIERAKAIFDLIEYLDEPFAKSQLQDIGLNPATADKWLNLIVFIQKQPRIRLVKSKRTTIIEKHEQRFHTMSREIFMDSNRSYEERFNALQDYLSALVTSERLHDQAWEEKKERERKLRKLKKLENKGN